MTFLLDTHGHYDFLHAESRADFLSTLHGQGMRVVAQTVLPSEFVALEADLERQAAEVGARLALPLPSLGFHPWYIGADAEDQLEIFGAAVGRTRLIGEIGLDFAPRRLEAVPAERQEQVFIAILDAVAQAAVGAKQPFVLSIHAVRSAGRVLELLSTHQKVARLIAAQQVVPIIHWFSGTSQELNRLIELGGYISVNPQMLGSKRGRAYIMQTPADRLLLETDLPDRSEAAGTSAVLESPATHGRAHALTIAQALSDTLNAISEFRGENVRGAILTNQRRLYGECL